MKKWLLGIFAFLLVFVTGCEKSSKFSKFQLEGQENLTTAVVLSVEDLDNKMNDKESFVFYVHSSMCGSCKSFKNKALDPFVKRTGTVIYQVDVNEIGNSSYSKKFKLKATPTFYIISKGTIGKKVVYDESKAMFTSDAGLEKYLKKYVYLPTMFKISEEDLDAKIANGDDFIVYFGWYLCGDCKKLNSRVLNNYLIKNMNGKKIYYFEVHEYIITVSQGREIWDAFVSKYHINNYRTGHVPALQYYKDGSLEDMFVYYNDVKDEETGMITTSFLPELVGQTLTEEEHLKKYDQAVTKWLNDHIALL